MANFTANQQHTARRVLALSIPLGVCLALSGCIEDNPPTYQGIVVEGTQEPEGAEPKPAEPEQADMLPAGSEPDSAAEVSEPEPTPVISEDGGPLPGGGDASVSSSAGEPDEPEPADDAEEFPLCVKDSDPNYSPRCCERESSYGEEIKKGSQCVPDPEVDLQLCYRECGPASLGWKEENCQAGVYAEQNCVFPPEVDYSCYQIPEDDADIDLEACGIIGDIPPKAVEECTAPPCMACNLGGRYVDTGDNAKDGYCVCREPDENGVRVWTCASKTAWPCPRGKGC